MTPTEIEADEDEVSLIGPNGRVETQEEHDRRIALNTKMRFHRSLKSSLSALLPSQPLPLIPFLSLVDVIQHRSFT